MSENPGRQLSTLHDPYRHFLAGPTRLHRFVCHGGGGGDEKLRFEVWLVVGENVVNFRVPASLFSTRLNTPPTARSTVGSHFRTLIHSEKATLSTVQRLKQ